MTTLESSDIQGFVVSSYKNLSCAAYVLLRITDPAGARAWLRQVLPDITKADCPTAPSSAINLAFSASGLAKLLHQDDLKTFPRAFQDGMASPRRRQILGDTHDSAPENWAWGSNERQVDILELVYLHNEDELTDLLAQRAAVRATFGGLEAIDPQLSPLRADPQPDAREHFGFNDGIARPAVEGFPGKGQEDARAQSKPLEPGEFVLGYPDDYGELAAGPTVDPARDAGSEPLLPDTPPGLAGRPGRDLGKNGSYLVFRQLEQHVAEFWQFLARETTPPPEQRDEVCERLASKLVGRWLSGAPLVKYPDKDPNPGEFVAENDFGYVQTDKFGLSCPIGAHIRRANPRDSLDSGPQKSLRSTRRHTILRRSRLYGQRIADRYQHDGQSRGIFFLCLNSDLERQFEFIQHSWLGNPVFAGLNGERDPIVGNSDGQGVMTIPADPVRTRRRNLASFVTVRGGAYFFMPGLRALRFLAEARD